MFIKSRPVYTMDPCYKLPLGPGQNDLTNAAISLVVINFLYFPTNEIFWDYPRVNLIARRCNREVSTMQVYMRIHIFYTHVNTHTQVYCTHIHTGGTHKCTVHTLHTYVMVLKVYCTHAVHTDVLVLHTSILYTHCAHMSTSVTHKCIVYVLYTQIYWCYTQVYCTHTVHTNVLVIHTSGSYTHCTHRRTGVTHKCIVHMLYTQMHW